MNLNQLTNASPAEGETTLLGAESGATLRFLMALVAASALAAGCGSDDAEDVTHGDMTHEDETGGNETDADETDGNETDADEEPEIEFVYTELTADGRPIRYLLDANNEGQMVGSVMSTTEQGALDGFVRGVDGTADFWTTPDRMAYPTAINDEGTVVGTNVPIGGGLPEGFHRDATGQETPYDFPEALGTVPFGISNDGTYSGFYITEEGRRGFVAQPSSGLSRSVEFPGAAETQLYGINDRGQAGGAYFDAMGTAFPFIYDIESDEFEEIEPPTAANYVVSNINDAGDAIVFGLDSAAAHYADLRSFYRDGRTGVMVELFYPGAVETYGYAIDNNGTILGYYLDENGEHGGFSAEIVQ